MAILRGNLKLISEVPNKDGTFNLIFEEFSGSIYKLHCTKKTLSQQFSGKSISSALQGIGCDYNTEQRTLLSDALYADRVVGALGGIDWQLSEKFC